jgi:putative hydrolase of HD superfamily
MAKKTLKRDLELLYEIGCLRFMERSWKRFLNPNFANLADHHLRVIWVSLILARHEKVANIEKVIKMALIHDVAESRTGDVDYLQRQYVKRLDDMGISDVLNGTIIEREFMALFKEYSNQKTLESRIVKDADNLDVDMEIIEQSTKGHKFKLIWQKYRRYVAKSKLNTDTARKLWKLIQSSNPHDWHLRGRNRFNEGDWSK